MGETVFNLDERSAKTLNVFKRPIRGKGVIEAGCKGCILCSTSHFKGLSRGILSYCEHRQNYR